MKAMQNIDRAAARRSSLRISAPGRVFRGLALAASILATLVA
jgi:hypothetical protein